MRLFKLTALMNFRGWISGKAQKFQFRLYSREPLNFISSIPWGLSSAGRASALHAEGHRFDPGSLQILLPNRNAAVQMQEAL